MPSENEILAALRGVNDPEIGRNIVDLGMVKDLAVQDGRIAFTLALTISGCPLRNQMAEESRRALLALPDVHEVVVSFGVMNEEERKRAFGDSKPALPKLTQFNLVRRVVAVMSGKGGVGKSSVTAMLAVALTRKGQKVGILDADITGPSIPRMFGLPPGGLQGGEQGMLPAATRGGIRVVSTNLLLREEDTAVIWRGPMISGTIKKFWSDTLWGRLDTLLVDLPPGTSDAALTVFNTMPVNGVIMVTSPQGLASMVVRKAVHMLQQVKVPVLGVVENMSYYVCPDTGSRHEIFGPSHAQEIAEEAQSPLWAQLPINPQIATECDAGRVEGLTLPIEMEQLAGQLIAVQAGESGVAQGNN